MPKPITDRKTIRKNCIERMDREGRLTAEELVQAASKRSHPMHVDFLWDNAKAGHLYRVEQAREYIRDVRIVTYIHETAVRSVAYVRDPAAAADEQGYVRVNTLRDERENAHKTLANEMSRIMAQIERASEIADALGLENEFDDNLRGLLKRTLGRARKGPPTIMEAAE